MVSQEVDGAGTSCDVGSCHGGKKEATGTECDEIEGEICLAGDGKHAGEISLFVHGGQLELQKGWGGWGRGETNG